MAHFKKRFLMYLGIALCINGYIYADQSLYETQHLPKFDFRFSVNGKAYRSVSPHQPIAFKKGEYLSLQVKIPKGITYPGKQFNFTIHPYKNFSDITPIDKSIYDITYQVDGKLTNACLFNGDQPHTCTVTYAAKTDKLHTSILRSQKHVGSSSFHTLKAQIEINQPDINYGRVYAMDSEILTLSAADDPKAEQIDLNPVYVYFPEGFDVNKIKKVKITISPQSKTIGDIYNANEKKHYTCVISGFTMPDPATGGFVCNTRLYFRPYRLGQTILKATAQIILKESLSKEILPKPMDVIAHVGTLLVGSGKLENDKPSYVIGRNILHSGNQLTTFDLNKSKLYTTDKTGLRYMVSDALSVPNRVSILSSTLIASAVFDVTKEGGEAVVSPGAFTQVENIYRSDGSGNVLTGFALADQGDGKVALTFADGRGTKIQRVLDYANTPPSQWVPVYLGALGIMDAANYISIPVNYSETSLNQNFAESMGYYYQFTGQMPNVGVKLLVKNPDADTTSQASFGLVVSYNDILFSVTPDKQGQTQLYYLDNQTNPEAPEWKKTSVASKLPVASEGIRVASVLSDGTLVIGYSADTKIVICQYNSVAPYYDTSRCNPIVVLGQGGVAKIAFDGQNRIYTLTGDGTITRLVKDPNKGYYETDSTTFNNYRNAFQTQADKGPGATSMVVIGNANTQLAIQN